MKQHFTLVILTLATTLAGCTAVKVRPVDNLSEIRHVCIQENPKVMVSDFVPVLEDGFRRHGISTERVNGHPAHCEFLLTYSARRSWDMAAYLSQAELRLSQGGRGMIATADYHLRGKGGLALNKWASTETKIAPVIDQLLTGR